MPFATTGAIIMNDAIAGNTMLSDVNSQSNQFIYGADLSELSVSGDSSGVAATEFLDRVLSPINKAKNMVVEEGLSLGDKATNPTQLVEFQKSLVEYNTNLIVASKCAKFAGDFVKEMTHIQ